MPEMPYSWLESQPDCYTVADLQAMSNDDLNALAAELRGWKLRIEEYQIGEPVIESGVLQDYVAADGCTMSAVADWSPCLDRNQSGKLLEWLASKRFSVSVWMDESGSKLVHISNAEYECDVRHHVTARAETIAFCAAMLATEGRLAKGK